MDEYSQINNLGEILAKYMLNIQAGQRPIKRAHLRSQLLSDSPVGARSFDSVLKAANDILAPLRYEIKPLKLDDDGDKVKKDPEYTIVSTLPRAQQKFVSSHLPESANTKFGLALFILGCVILSGPSGITEDQLDHLFEQAGLDVIENSLAAIKFSLDQKLVVKSTDEDQAPTLKVGPRARLNVSYNTMLNQMRKMLWPDLSRSEDIPADELEYLNQLLHASRF